MNIDCRLFTLQVCTWYKSAVRSELSQRNTNWQLCNVYNRLCEKSISFFLLLIKITQFSLNIWLSNQFFVCVWSDVLCTVQFNTSADWLLWWWISEQIPMFLWRVSELNQSWLKYCIWLPHNVSVSVNKIELHINVL